MGNIGNKLSHHSCTDSVRSIINLASKDFGQMGKDKQHTIQMLEKVGDDKDKRTALDGITIIYIIWYF